MDSSRSTSRAGSRAHALALLLAVLAGAGALPAQAGDCPANGIEKPGFTYSSVAGVYQSPEGTDFGLTVYDGWDLTKGTLRIHHWGGLGTSTVHASDLYDVTGVPPGTEVVVTVRMDVAAWAATPGCGGTGCAGVVTGRITTPQGTVEQFGIGHTYSGLVPCSFYVETDLTMTAGTPVPVTFSIEGRRTAGGSHAADGVGTIRFLGLSGGEVVVSCQGYVDPSTPVHPSSWGTLKARYR